MPGIEDLMNLRTQGGTANVPPMPPQGMAGGPPVGMGGPPVGMGGPPVGMGGGMGETPVEMGGGMGGPPVEEVVNVEQDSAMLAEAVVDRTQGDIGAAIAVLDNAKAMLMSSVEGGQDPMMANMGRPLMRRDGGPMYANMGGELNPGLQALQKTNPEVVDQIMERNMGGPMYANMGRPLYREDGGTMSDDDVLRQMIMDNLQKPEIQEQAMDNVMGQSGRSMSDKDRAMDNVMGQSGRSMSDRDRAIADLMRFNQA